jgi:flagellar basal-body rod protein FlgB
LRVRHGDFPFPSSRKVFPVDTGGMTANPPSVDLLSKALEASLTRHQAISQNLANVNTPGYRAVEVQFEQQLADALKLGLPYDQVQPQVKPSAGLMARADGNNVDIDREIGQLGKNTVMYQTLTQVLASQLGMLRSAITGR